jgi:TetR/AcrR family tetracycline transcriptional repressor
MYMSSTQGSAKDLTREAVIDAAAAILAESGYGGVNMRAIADRCGVATMTLYRHVRTKEDVLGALADRVLEELEVPPPGGGPDWREDIATVLRSMRTLLLEHRELAEIAARLHFNSLATYRGTEAVLDALRRAGVEGDAAVSAFAALVAFTRGFALQQVNSSSPSELGQRLLGLESLPADEFQNVTSLGTKLLLRDSDRHFEAGLSLLLEGIAAEGRA